MNAVRSTISILVTGALLCGCPGGDDTSAQDSSGAATGDSTDGGSMPPGTTSGMDTTSGVPTTTTPGTDSSGGSDTAGTDSSTGDDPFVFDPSPPDAYTRVDRLGFPAVNTGLNLAGDKDAYNAADPSDDASLTFINDIFLSLEILHVGVPGMQTMDNTGLDDDLAALGLSTCVPPPGGMATCDNQVGPFVIPDTLKIDLDDPAGFPNGRAPQDPVMDIILAVLLLDLGTEAIDAFFDIDGMGTPLNPATNDVAFPGAWPYLAPAH